MLQASLSPDAWVASMAFPDDQHGYLYVTERLGGLIGPEAVSPRFAFRTVHSGGTWTQLPSSAWGSYFAFSGPERDWSMRHDHEASCFRSWPARDAGGHRASVPMPERAQHYNPCMPTTPRL